MTTETELEEPAQRSMRKKNMRRILRRHAEGLPRVATVIDGNEHYDALLSHRLSQQELDAFPADLNLDVARARAIELALESLRRRARKLFIPSYSGFACDGITQNNIREFEFFEQLCKPLGVKLLANNYAAAEKASAHLPNRETAWVVSKMMTDIRAFYAERRRISPSLVHQQVLYSKSFLNLLTTFTDKRAILPSALVLANDHSPSRVAISMVMRGLGVKRIYLQHAEVAECFPPLDFEYSILRNNRSLSLYKQVGKVRGRTFVIGRTRAEPNIDSLCRPLDGRMDVVIYPTSRVVSEALMEMVVRLKANPGVSSIALKQHPGAARPLDELLKGTGISVVRDFPEFHHIAIVGNSSVTLELIAKGIPVYQNFEFDPVARDYYGFLRDGITKEAPLERLGDRFWTQYQVDEAWRTALSSWLPETRSSDADAAAFLAEMAIVSAANPSHETSRDDRARAPAYAAHKNSKGDPEGQTAQHTSTATPAFKQSDSVSIRQRLKFALKRALARRPRLVRASAQWLNQASIRLHRIAQAAEPHAPANIQDLAVKDRRPLSKGKSDENAKKTPDAQLTLKRDIAIITHMLVHSRDPVECMNQTESLRLFETQSWIKAIDTMIRERHPAILDLFESLREPRWDSAVSLYAYLRRSAWINAKVTENEIDRAAKLVESPDLSPANQIALADALFPAIVSFGTPEQLDALLSPDSRLRWQRLGFARQTQLLRRLASIAGREDEVASRIHDLKQTSPLGALKLQNFMYLSGWLDADWTHEIAERNFLRVAPEAVARDFQNQVAPVYDDLRPRMQFMEVRANAEQRTALIELVRKAIIEQSPFSCIRLSDREGYLFSAAGEFTPADISNCELHWWGAELPVALRERIIMEAREAVGAADIVGIPAVYRFIRDITSKTPSLHSSLQFRGLVAVLAGLQTVAGPQCAFAEDKVNVGLLHDINQVAELAANARTLVIVSSISTEHLPQELRQHANFRHVSLPSHYKTRGNEMYERGEDILPNIYPRIALELEEAVTPGTLVLMAGGLVGKILAGKARAKGGVVLDIGHVVDDWATARFAPIR